MVSYRKDQRRLNAGIYAFAVACLSVVLAALLGFGIAAAGGNAPAQPGSFGFDQDGRSSSSPSFTSTSDMRYESTQELARPTTRDISGSLAAIDAEEQAKREAEQEAIAKAQSAQAEAAAVLVAEGASDNGDGSYCLSDGSVVNIQAVDWSVGEEAFVAEWTERIDSYLAGSPLAGHGATFAQAAWDYGVDPRWSPAIANTESGKGTQCFLPYNAWGWGSSSFTNWDDAIYAHVAGLAAGYGGSISVEAAQKYCPPNSANWFKNTCLAMETI